MKNRLIISIVIFLICWLIPMIIYNLFPDPCGGYGLCFIIFYPFVIFISLLTACAFYYFSKKINFKKPLLAIIFLFAGLLIIAYFYPKGKFNAFNQIKLSIEISGNYHLLKPTDIFHASVERDNLLITALYHKFNLPEEIYYVKYCTTKGDNRCDSLFHRMNYFVYEGMIYTDNHEFNFNLNIADSSLSFVDHFFDTIIVITVGYPEFGKYREDFDSHTADIKNGLSYTGLSKNFDNFRVFVGVSRPKFEYPFTKIFEWYLNLRKKDEKEYTQEDLIEKEEIKLINLTFLELVGTSYYFEKQPFPPMPIPDNATKFEIRNDSINRLQYFKLINNKKLDTTTLVIFFKDTLINYHNNLSKSYKTNSFTFTDQNEDTIYNELLKELFEYKQPRVINISEIKFTGRYELHLPEDETKLEFSFRKIGHMRYSRIIFNNEMNKACFYFEFICGPLCGEGAIVLLKKVNGVWQIKGYRNVWVG